MYNANELKQRLNLLAKERGVSMRRALQDCGLNPNTVNQAKARSGLSSATLCALADYFGCSVDYILGREKILTAQDIEDVVDAINAGAEMRELIDRYGADLARNWNAIENLALLIRREETEAGTGSAPAGAGK